VGRKVSQDLLHSHPPLGPSYRILSSAAAISISVLNFLLPHSTFSNHLMQVYCSGLKFIISLSQSLKLTGCIVQAIWAIHNRPFSRNLVGINAFHLLSIELLSMFSKHNHSISSLKQKHGLYVQWCQFTCGGGSPVLYFYLVGFCAHLPKSTLKPHWFAAIEVPQHAPEPKIGNLLP